MNYKVVSVVLLILASAMASLILFTKKTENVFVAPQGEIAKENIKSIESVNTILEDSPSVTNAVAKSIADDLLNRNPKGPQPSQNQPGVMSISALDPKIIAGNILEDETLKVITNIFSGAPAPSDIKTNSSVTDNEYLLARSKIIREAQVSLGKYAGRDFDDTVLRAMNEAAAKSLSQLKDLTVPRGLFAIHGEQVRLIAAEYAISKNLLDRDSDPVAAAISISLIQRVDQELTGLSEKIKTYIEQHPS